MEPLIPQSRIDHDAMKVIYRLRRYGHKAYLVGGCVRDSLLGLKPKDFDVATSAQPQEIKKIFTNCRLIGHRFRLAHIIFRGKIIETATFRSSQGFEQDQDLLIRSDNVFGTEEEDARRRDFTVNALFYDPVEQRLIDYVGGLEDIRTRRLRFIGDPRLRVCEDPVRILRAIRLSARLDLSMDDELMQVLTEYRHYLQKSAHPRLLEEIIRMLRSGASARAMMLMWRTRVLEVILPEVGAYLASAPEREEIREPGAGLFALLGAVDQSQRELLSNPVLISCLLLPVVEDAVDGGNGRYHLPHNLHAAGELACHLLERWVRELSLPRWQRARVQQLLALERKLRHLHIRHPLPHGLVKRSCFPEVVDLFGCIVRASGRGQQQYKLLLRLARRRNHVTPAPEGGKNEAQRQNQAG